MATVEQVYRKHHPARAGQASSFEVWSWFFMRISGILLVFLALGHLAIMHVFGGGVERVNFDFVAARWGGLFWRTYDWLLLTLAIIHGANGARVVIDDYVRRDGWRALLKTTLLVATFVFLVLGTFVIVTFDAGAEGGPASPLGAGGSSPATATESRGTALATGNPGPNMATVEARPRPQGEAFRWYGLLAVEPSTPTGSAASTAIAPPSLQVVPDPVAWTSSRSMVSAPTTEWTRPT